MSRTRIPNYDSPTFQKKRAKEIRRRSTMKAYDNPVARAYRGDTAELAAELRARGERDVAWLIESVIPPRRDVGNPEFGKTDYRTEEQKAERLKMLQVYADVLAGQEADMKKSGQKKVDSHTTDGLIRKALEERGVPHTDDKVQHVFDTFKRGRNHVRGLIAARLLPPR